MYRRRLALLIAILMPLSLFSFSCGPKPGVEVKETPSSYVPEVFGLRILASNGLARMQWKTDRDKGETFGGYDVYMVPADNVSSQRLEPINAIRYPGDTDGNPRVESFETDEIRPGEVYKGWVVAYSGNGENRSASDTIEFCPVTEGEFTISLLYSRTEGGFDLSAGRYAPARSPDSDIMFYGRGTVPRISAPASLDESFNKTRFAYCDRDKDFDSVIEFDPLEYEWRTSIPLTIGKPFLAILSNGRFAKLVCTGLKGKSGRAKASFRYVYIPVEGYLRFQ